MINILRTSSTVLENGAKMVIYGESGVGKTTLIKTLPNPIILSAESGLASISDDNLPYVNINSMRDLEESYQYLKHNNDYESIAIDSISEIAEICLAEQKKVNKDPRKAYGNTNEIILDFLRKFRGMRKNIYLSAKLATIQDDTKKIFYNPSMPGKSLSESLIYYFDFVGVLRTVRDENGNTKRFIQCENDGIYQGKSRTCGESPQSIFEPNLKLVIEKIGEKQKSEEEIADYAFNVAKDLISKTDNVNYAKKVLDKFIFKHETQKDKINELASMMQKFVKKDESEEVEESLESLADINSKPSQNESSGLFI